MISFSEFLHLTESVKSIPVAFGVNPERNDEKLKTLEMKEHGWSFQESIENTHIFSRKK